MTSPNIVFQPRDISWTPLKGSVLLHLYSDFPMSQKYFLQVLTFSDGIELKCCMCTKLKLD